MEHKKIEGRERERERERQREREREKARGRVSERERGNQWQDASPGVWQDRAASFRPVRS